MRAPSDKMQFPRSTSLRSGMVLIPRPSACQFSSGRVFMINTHRQPNLLNGCVHITSMIHLGKNESPERHGAAYPPPERLPDFIRASISEFHDLAKSLKIRKKVPPQFFISARKSGLPQILRAENRIPPFCSANRTPMKIIMARESLRAPSDKMQFSRSTSRRSCMVLLIPRPSACQISCGRVFRINTEAQ